MDAFDQSFEYWEKEGVSDVNVSFEANEIFDFSTLSVGAPEEEVPADNIFPHDPVFENESLVRVTIVEQLSVLYDDSSDQPSCQVEGWVHVRPEEEGACSIVLRDLMGHLESIQGKEGVSEIRPPPADLHVNDRVLVVSQSSDHRLPVASYLCSSSLQPVLMVSTTDPASKTIDAVCLICLSTHCSTAARQEPGAGLEQLVSSRFQDPSQPLEHPRLAPSGDTTRCPSCRQS